MRSVYRVLDANGNRAREALRVMEEAARFLLDDAALCEALKSIRHGVALALAPYQGLGLLHRDTPGDVGTGITPAKTMPRTSVADAATAAGKRLSEALRAIEEYLKTLPGGGASAAAVEALRYQGYEVERRLGLALAAGRAPQWPLCVLITESVCPGGDWFGIAELVTRPGPDGAPAAPCLQLREKSLEGGALLARAARLARLCAERRVDLVINDRPDIAMLVSAAGVHVGQGDLPCAEVRRLVGPEMLVGVSTSCVAEARQARLDGASYVGLGPMFPTTTKHKEHIVGPDYLRAFLDAMPDFPHLAIAGVTAENAGLLAGVGARGVAVTASVSRAPDPYGACLAIKRALAG